MLRSFRVENHKSIKDEQELSLLPAYDKSRPVVPVAAIFGANASGKSNLLDALRWLQNAVRTSYAAWEAGSGVPRTPFRLDPKAAEAPSGYAVEIVVDGERYSYGVEVDDERVRQEWLYSYPRNRRRIIFERDADGVRLGSTVSDYRARADALMRQTRDNAMFLAVAAQNGLDETEPIFRWFRTDIVFGDANTIDEDRLVARLRNGSSLVSLIQAADLGIMNVRDRRATELTDLDLRFRAMQAAQETALADLEAAVRSLQQRRNSSDDLWREADNVADEASRRATAIFEDLRQLKAELDAFNAPRLEFQHGKSGGVLTLADQSAGTRSWIALVAHALDVLDSGGLLVVDEVDASLHPHLSAHLINLFRGEETNRKYAQLVFTTHDATLLDEETLSRDEVWFVEKEPDTGATRLYPLTDFHPRKNENTEGRYLAGGYGAVPVLSDFDFREAVRRRRSPDDAA